MGSKTFWGQFKIWRFSQFVSFLKFVFSKKATKIDEIFTVDLTLCSVKSMVKISSIFVAFLENMNFTSRIRQLIKPIWKEIFALLHQKAILISFLFFKSSHQVNTKTVVKYLENLNVSITDYDLVTELQSQYRSLDE